MTTIPTSSSSVRSAGDNGGERAVASYSADLRILVFALFFVFGGITSLNDVLIPKLKGLFTLSYGEVMLVQTAFFTAYLLISIPAAAVLHRLGYIRTAVVGLLTMAAGCLLFVPASASAQFALFLVALFVIAAGITTVQVVANPLISMLGAPATAHSRLTFAQAFNSLGTTVFPYVGARLILGSLASTDASHLAGAALNAYRAAESGVIARAYMGLALFLAAIAILAWLSRKRLIETAPAPTSILHAFDLLRRPRFAFGALCIFLYVGAEVAIGSLIVGYLMQTSVLGFSAEVAGKHVSYYWGGAMLGRFIGAALLRLFSPGKILALAAGCVVALLLTSANTIGALSGWSLLAIGLFNSIMFPTIFSLASEGLGKRADEGSGLLCVCIFGGAVIPYISGHTIDIVGLKLALTVPAICYLGILGFGWFARRPATDSASVPAGTP